MRVINKDCLDEFLELRDQENSIIEDLKRLKLKAITSVNSLQMINIVKELDLIAKKKQLISLQLNSISVDIPENNENVNKNR